MLIFLFLVRPFPESHCCSVAQMCPTLCDPMDCSTPGFPVLHHLSEFAQIHVHWVSDTIQCYCSFNFDFWNCSVNILLLVKLITITDIYLAHLMYAVFQVNSLSPLHNPIRVTITRPIFVLSSHGQKLQSGRATFQIR